MIYDANQTLVPFGQKDLADAYFAGKAEELGRAPNYGAEYTNEGILYTFEYESLAEELSKVMDGKV